jgi:hypothetical protein
LELGFTLESLAGAVDTRLQTISRVEAGSLVPRDYLRAAIAYALATEVDNLWTPPTRKVIYTMAGAA